MQFVRALKDFAMKFVNELLHMNILSGCPLIVFWTVSISLNEVLELLAIDVKFKIFSICIPLSC